MQSRGTLTQSFKSLYGEVGNWYTPVKLSFFRLPADSYNLGDLEQIGSLKIFVHLRT